MKIKREPVFGSLYHFLKIFLKVFLQLFSISSEVPGANFYPIAKNQKSKADLFRADLQIHQIHPSSQ